VTIYPEFNQKEHVMALSEARFRVKSVGYGFEVHDCVLKPRPEVIAQFPGNGQQSGERAEEYASYLNNRLYTDQQQGTPAAREEPPQATCVAVSGGSFRITGVPLSAEPLEQNRAVLAIVYDGETANWVVDQLNARRAVTNAFASEAMKIVENPNGCAQAPAGRAQAPVDIPQSLDAREWAEKFTYVVRNKPGALLDEGFILGWFANAIERGHDRGHEQAMREHVERLEKHKGWVIDPDAVRFTKTENAARLFVLYGNAGHTISELMQRQPSAEQIEAAARVAHAAVEHAADVMYQHHALVRLKQVLLPDPQLMHFVNMLGVFLIKFVPVMGDQAIKGMPFNPQWGEAIAQLIALLGITQPAIDEHRVSLLPVTTNIYNMIKKAVAP
jgi:hypothetical protein